MYTMIHVCGTESCHYCFSLRLKKTVLKNPVQALPSGFISEAVSDLGNSTTVGQEVERWNVPPVRD